MVFYIKYWGIILCSIYIYKRLFNLSIGKKQVLFLLLVPTCLSYLAILVDNIYPTLTMVFLILLFFLYLTKIEHFHAYLSLVISIISNGISYIIFVISATIAAACFPLLLQLSFDTYNHALLQLLTAFTQICITILLFQNKRLRKGMPILSNNLNNIPLTMACILCILALWVMFIRGTNTLSNTFFLLFIFFLGIFIYFSWKSSITKIYLERLKERDIIDLNAELEEKAAYIEKLEADNEELAKIIHSDNKLIPAMELAVTTFLKDGDASDYDRAERGEALVKDLERLSRNRKGILKTQDAKCQNIPPTGISSIDSLLSYMQQKAWEYDVTLVGAISCDLMPIIEKYLTEEELNTLLADLLENALIATQYNGSHHMLLQIDFLEKIYAISVYDSGIAFSKEVLVNLGLRNYTTHGDAGGSGIGLVSTFDLAQKCNASLVIDEYMPGSGLYSKKLSIVFNRLGQYNLYTYRGKKELDFLKQRTNLIITEKFSANTSPRPSAER